MSFDRLRLSNSANEGNIFVTNSLSRQESHTTVGQRIPNCEETAHAAKVASWNKHRECIRCDRYDRRSALTLEVIRTKTWRMLGSTTSAPEDVLFKLKG